MKKTISILLIVAMMLASMLAIIPASAAPRGEAIETAEDFANMAPDGEYYLANDIVIKSSYTEEFKGRLDGDGHTITVYSATPVFEKVAAERITNLNINTSFESGIPSGGNFGALARVASGTITKINATVNFKFTEKTNGTNIGGLIGQINGEARISGSTVKGAIIETLENDTGASVVGGIVGNVTADAEIEISSSANYATLDIKESGPSAGGIVGIMTGQTRLTVDNCQNYGDITFLITKGEHTGIAGIVGHVSSSSSSKASVEVNDCRNSGNITGTGNKNDHMVGGIVGRINGIKKARVDGCVNSGNITSGAVGWGATGGIVANVETYNYTWSNNTEADIRITNSVNIGAVSGSGNGDTGNGGILGSVLQANTPNVKVQILTCANYGNISGNNSAGIMGKQGTGGGGNKLIIRDCYNNGGASAGIVAAVHQQWANIGEYGSSADKNILGDATVGEGEDAKNVPTKPYEIPEIINCVSDSGAIITNYTFHNYVTENSPMANSKITITNCVGSVPSGDKYAVTAPTDAGATTAATKAAVPGNPAEIDALIGGYADAVATDYESGWDAFETLYKQATAAVKKATLQSVFDELIPALEEALDNLVAKEIGEEELVPLATAIAQYKETADDEANVALYTPRTWEAFTQALSAAQAVYNEADGVDSTVKLSDLDKAIDAMKDAFDALALIPDRTNINNTFADYAELDQTKYVSASWTAFQKAMAEAKAVNDDVNSVKEDIDAALKLIKDAKNALVLKADPASLAQKAEATLAEYAEEKYTAKSYNDLSTIVKQIKKAAEGNDMSAVDINEKSAALDAAVSALVLRGNFDEIDALLEQFGEIIIGGDKPEVDADLVEELEDTYTRGSVDNLFTALNNVAQAKKKDNIPNFSENDAARLLKTLQSAIEALVPYADYTEIDAKIIEISALDKTKYTEESWAALEAALKTAADLKYNRNASKPQSDAALEALNAAFAGLVEVEVEEVVEEKGCKSAIGATIVVMTATLALGATTLLKKKED